ncbi:hypothetical protein PsorP6_010442 [Peronosclerospora sorghi]|uniref:Uncharacterized protein n=1 Tax=Peronosclerospora sorghi TaxID=230839 RepID=A0ACC0VW60_9STRA|nr:hypothetical protein PsorP6_010442 [Peronosclerospora sorghi]
MNKSVQSSSLSHCCCVRYGRTHVLCSLSRTYGFFPSTCHIGPHWCCMLTTYCLALGPAFLFFADKLHVGSKVALLVSISFSTASLTMVACSDPGVVFQNALTAGDDETGIVCERGKGMQLVINAGIASEHKAQCEVQRPFNASHCSDCGVCVVELDHHCPWTGKCVGKRTIVWFYVFLTIISLHCMLTGAICLVTFAAR